MKCSHGLPFEVKCRGCFEDAMKLYPETSISHTQQIEHKARSETMLSSITLDTILGEHQKHSTMNLTLS